MEAINQRRVNASAAARHATSAPSSVFDVGQRAKAEAAATRKPRQRTDFDIDAVTIRTDVPPPALTNGPRTSKYRQLLDRMQSGESVVVPARVGYGLKSAAKKAEIKITVRTLGDGTMGIWKL